MERKTRKRPQITEKIDVGCAWKFIGTLDNRHGCPSRKLLSNAKHENKHFHGTGHPLGSSSTTNLAKNCQHVTNASENVVRVNSRKRNATKQFEDDEMHKSRQILDALEILDSNSELFLKLIKDPNSLLIKHIHSVKDLQAVKEKCKPLIEDNLSECGISSNPKKCPKSEHIVHMSLLERIKSEDRCPSTDAEISCTTNSIMVLKPSQKEQGRHDSEKYNNLESSTRSEIAVTSKSICKKLQSSTVSYSNRRDLEAKRRLSNRLRNVEKSENLSVKQAPRTLSRILCSPLSSPEHDFSSIFNSKMDSYTSVSPQKRYPACINFQQSNENNVLQLNSDDQLQIFDSEREIQETVNSSEAYLKTMNVSDVKQSGQVNLSEMLSKKGNLYITNAEKSSNTIKSREENQYLEHSMQKLHLKNQALDSSSGAASSGRTRILKVETEGSSKDREEHLSPVSVLDSSFAEDVTSPSSSIKHPAKPPVQPLNIDFEEDSSLPLDPIDYKLNICSCIRTVLQASELNWDELSKNARSSGQLLNLFSSHEHNLFAGFLNDVLLEVNERNVECKHWTSFIKPDTQAFSVLGKIVVEEVMKEVQWYLVPPVIPRTREHLIAKDMEKPECWSGTRIDAEHIVIETLDNVLDELIRDTILVIEEQFSV